MDPARESAVSLFQEKRYGEAYAVFRSCCRSQPDDARVWYYAALSYGLSPATGVEMTQIDGRARESPGRRRESRRSPRSTLTSPD